MHKQRLWEIAKEIEETIEKISLAKEKGEGTDDLIKNLLELESHSEDKVDRCIAYDRTLNNLISLYKGLRDDYDKKLKSLENLSERFKSYIKSILENNPELVLSGTTGKIALQKNAVESLNISLPVKSINWSQIIAVRPMPLEPQYLGKGSPFEFVDKFEVVVLNKDRIKDYIKRGGHLDWCQVERGNHVRFKI